MDREAWHVLGCKESNTTEQLNWNWKWLGAHSTNRWFGRNVYGEKREAKERHYWLAVVESLDVCDWLFLGFPGSSAGKNLPAMQEFCNAELDSWVGKICWRTVRLPTPEFLYFPLAQLVNNPPAVRETWVRSLFWEDPPEKETATHSSILAWRIPRAI